MAQVSVDIEGIEGLNSKLQRLIRRGAYKRGLKAGGVHVKGKIASYPDKAGVRQQGDPRGWYERGYGSKWMRRDGSIAGRKTSETLGRKWTVSQDGLKTIVGNNVSYGQYVQSEQWQARIHKNRWKTIEEVAKKERETVVKLIKQEVDKDLKK